MRKMILLMISCFSFVSSISCAQSAEMIKKVQFEIQYENDMILYCFCLFLASISLVFIFSIIFTCYNLKFKQIREREIWLSTSAGAKYLENIGNYELAKMKEITRRAEVSPQPQYVISGQGNDAKFLKVQEQGKMAFDQDVEKYKSKLFKEMWEQRVKEKAEQDMAEIQDISKCTTLLQEFLPIRNS